MKEYVKIFTIAPGLPYFLWDVVAGLLFVETGSVQTDRLTDKRTDSSNCQFKLFNRTPFLSSELKFFLSLF